MTDLFDAKDLIPNGYCLSCSPGLLWLHVVSDLLITFSFYSILPVFVYFIRPRTELPYPRLVAVFAGFIVACGATHLLSVITVWMPLYWLEGLFKAFAAIFSVAIAVSMLRAIPSALFVSSAAQLQAEIEQRKMAEKALRESENKLAAILDSVEAFIYIKDCNYQYRYANQPLRQLFGKAAEDIIGKSDDDFFDQATAAKLRENDRCVIEQGECTASEEIGIDKNNAAYAYLTVKQPLRREDGGIYGLCGISTDITERRQMEEKLRDRDAFNVGILNSLTSHIAVLDAQGVVVAVNDAWRRFAKEYGSQNMLGFNYLDACKNAFNQPYGDQADSAHIGIAGVLAGELETFQLEYPCHSPDRQRWFHMNVSPLQGSRHGAVVSHENITERKYREQQDKEHLDELAHVTRRGLMGEMASGIAHEVNQPLSAISSYTQVSLNLINTEDPDLVKLTEILHKTQQQALRAGWIVHRMREFVQSHSKYRSTADVNNLIHNAVGLCIADLKRNHIRLTFELKSNLPPICVDYIQIEQVIINLIRNSIESLQNLPAKQQRQLTIHSRLIRNDGVQVRMKDNGPGIDENQQQKILTPFYTTKTDGMGMGLSISRSLIEAHEGTLHFNSKPGKGATFYFTLPIHRKPDGC
ncbi:MAG: PAS domain-containing protein [Methylobacter sp.]|jgi:PAS domain S-box-containing protein|nr:PAS domain-containing protein [Methylobacter sp.]